MEKKIYLKYLDNLIYFIQLHKENDLTVWLITDEQYEIPERFQDSVNIVKLALTKNEQGLLTVPQKVSEVDQDRFPGQNIDFSIFMLNRNLIDPGQKCLLFDQIGAKSRNILIYSPESDLHEMSILRRECGSAGKELLVERYSELLMDLPFRWFQKIDPENQGLSQNGTEVQTLINIVRRQRNLLVEYQQETVRIETESEDLFHENERLQEGIRVINRLFLGQISDWQAFETTSTAKLVKLIVQVKTKILPSEGKLSRFLLYSIKFKNVIREEGIKSAQVLVFQKVKRFLYRIRYRFHGRRAEGKVYQIEEVSPGHPDPVRHTENVDIIVCVHNALIDVQNCLNSLISNTTMPYRIILVDDGSQLETAEYLKDFSIKHQGVLLLRSEEATGYTYAANRGMRASDADYVVLLNSDTIVGPCWIDQMVACAQSDQKIGIVGPISNTASWQSVPKIEDNGDWAENPLPPGVSVQGMAESISAYSERIYVDMPFLNGFCLLIKKQLLDEVGLFDEVIFGKGYGEEDDLILRARQAGWRMALADDTFVYHAQSKSYSSERRKELSESAGKNLLKKHSPEIIKAGVKYCSSNLVLEGIRARAAVTPDRDTFIQLGKKYAGKRVLFLLPSNGPGGGANVVIYEGLAMQKMGVEVEIFNLPPYRADFEKAYPNLSINVNYRDIADLPRLSGHFDAIVATHNETVYWLARLNRDYASYVAGYYIQGFEPLMYNRSNPRYQRALDTYSLIPDLIQFTKTTWTQTIIREHTSTSPETIGISLDIDLFRPRPNLLKEKENRPLRVAAMVRPESHYREPEKTMLLLQKASQHYGGQIEPVIFGTTVDNPAFLNLPHNFPWQLYGIISSKKVANLLNSVDIFIDYSSHQAMGLTALEAMATGCAVIVPSNGGAVEFSKHEHNALVVDTSNFDDVWIKLKRLIDDDKLRKTIQRNAIYDVCQYFPEKAAYNILNCLFGK